jgi:hypothetical protein
MGAMEWAREVIYAIESGEAPEGLLKEDKVT